MRKLGIVISVALLAVGAICVGALPANAGSADRQNSVSAANYPINEIKREADDKCGRHAVLRRGYYDGKNGFGFDKMFHKHNLKHTGVFVFVLGNPNCGEPQGDTTRRYDAYAHRIQCGAGGCQVVDIRRLFMPVNYRNDPSIPGIKGMITLYCFEGGEARCPDWVDQSINVRSDQNEVSSTFSPEASVLSYLPLDSNRIYSREEITGLTRQAS